jgi:hypothetical protein
MPAWEYLHISVQENEVYAVNGEWVHKEKAKGPFDSNKLYSLHEYLSVIGKDEWEVVSITPLDRKGYYAVIAKRPIK